MNPAEDDLKRRLTTGAAPSDFDPDALWADVAAELPAAAPTGRPVWYWPLGALVLGGLLFSLWWSTGVTNLGAVAGADDGTETAAGVRTTPTAANTPETTDFTQNKPGGGGQGQASTPGAAPTTASIGGARTTTREGDNSGTAQRSFSTGRSSRDDLSGATAGMVTTRGDEPSNPAGSGGSAPAPKPILTDGGLAGPDPASPIRVIPPATRVLPAGELHRPLALRSFTPFWGPEEAPAIEGKYRATPASRFAYSVALGANLERQSAGGVVSTANDVLTTETLGSALGQSANVGLRYRVNDRIALHTGLTFNRIHNTFSLITERDSVMPRNDLPGADLIPALAVRTVRQNNFRTELVVPLSVGFGGRRDRLSYELQLGGAYHFVLGQSGKVLDAEGAIVTFDNDRPQLPANYLSLHLQPEVAYRIGDGVDLFGQLRWSFANTEAAGRPWNLRQYGGLVGLRFTPRKR